MSRAKKPELDQQLPFVQVHRSVGPKAAQLASALGLTYPHVRGALVIFWESLADRRLLARYARRYVDGLKLVMPAADLAVRLKMAFTVDVPLPMFEAAGFLELLPNGEYRVRGGSRLVKPEAHRLRLAGTGEPGGEGPGEGPGESPGRVPGRAPTPTPPEERGERREEKGERRKAKGDRAPSAWEDLWNDAQDLRSHRLHEREIEHEREEASPAYLNTVLGRQFGQLREIIPTAEAADWLLVWDAYLKADWGAKYDEPWPLGPFVKGWPGLLRDIHGAGVAA